MTTSEWEKIFSKAATNKALISKIFKQFMWLNIKINKLKKKKKNTGVGCHALPQGIFPTQGLNPGFPHCRQIFSCLSHQGSPRILQWAAYPFSGGSSRPRIEPRPALQQPRWS